MPALGLTLDHVIPQARGGRHEPRNLVPACRRCNGRKATRTAGEYLELLLCERIERALAFSVAAPVEENQS